MEAVASCRCERFLKRTFRHASLGFGNENTASGFENTMYFRKQPDRIDNFVNNTKRQSKINLAGKIRYAE